MKPAVYFSDGGRTRTRTLDPLIKSQLHELETTSLFFRLHLNARIMTQ
jgi:hypothetical protein